MREVQLLLSAVQYFTRVPMPAWVGHERAQLSGTTRYFPAVGIAVGAAAATVFWAASLVFPPWIAAILSVVASAAITGGLHEDGLADTMDGLGGGHTRERALEIMKDPRIGAFGALSLMLMLGLKVATLSALPLTAVVAALISGHALSRWCAVLLIWRLPYARADNASRARPVVERVARTDILVAALAGLAPLAAWIAFAAANAVDVLAPRAAASAVTVSTARAAGGALTSLAQYTGGDAWYGSGASTVVLAALAAIAATALLGVWYKRRLGGYTGDTLGATQQITEIVFYLALLAAWNSR